MKRFFSRSKITTPTPWIIFHVCQNMFLCWKIMVQISFIHVGVIMTKFMFKNDLVHINRANMR